MQRQYKSQKRQKNAKESNRQDSKSTAGSQLDMTSLTPDSVMLLQQKYGNQATQQILRKPDTSPVHTVSRTVIQRAETGLRNSGATDRVVQLAHEFANKPSNANKPIQDLIDEIQSHINTELKGQKVPEIAVIGGAAGKNGEFDFTTWQTELNIASTFGGKNTIGELTQKEIANSVNTLYHESRHGEQWFRIARMRAGKALTKDDKDTKRRQVATQIAQAMFIPQNIALEAANWPLYESWESKFGGGADKAMEEAKAWDKSIYGADGAYRGLILSTLATAESAARRAVHDVMSAARPDIAAKWATAGVTISQLVTIKDAEIANEIARLQAIQSRSQVEDTMLNHLNQLTTFIDEAEALKNAARKISDLRPLLDKTYEIARERHQAYVDLPEETDAWATGDTAETKYGNVGATN